MTRTRVRARARRRYCQRRPAFDDVACGLGCGARTGRGGGAPLSGATPCGGALGFFEKSGMLRSPLCLIGILDD
jgi:hypothetical protein